MPTASAVKNDQGKDDEDWSVIHWSPRLGAWEALGNFLLSKMLFKVGVGGEKE
jgi:hypothetical protein